MDVILKGGGFWAALDVTANHKYQKCLCHQTPTKSWMFGRCQMFIIQPISAQIAAELAFLQGWDTAAHLTMSAFSAF